MASLLDWDLESQIYPIVRWLVHHRRAKVVDTVHHALKTVFTLPPKFETPCVLLTFFFVEALTLTALLSQFIRFDRPIQTRFPPANRHATSQDSIHDIHFNFETK
jgi:hypothetical protein